MQCLHGDGVQAVEFISCFLFLFINRTTFSQFFDYFDDDREAIENELLEMQTAARNAGGDYICLYNFVQ